MRRGLRRDQQTRRRSRALARNDWRSAVSNPAKLSWPAAGGIAIRLQAGDLPCSGCRTAEGALLGELMLRAADRRQPDF